MLSCFYYWNCKTDLIEVTYSVLTNILIYVETAIPTWCLSASYPKFPLACYVL